MAARLLQARARARGTTLSARAAVRAGAFGGGFGGLTIDSAAAADAKREL